MIMYSGKNDTKTAKKIVGILSDLITEIGNGSEIHLDLSGETRDACDCHVPCYLCQPTGNMTLVVKWKKANQTSAIDEKRFEEIAAEVKKEMGYSTLTNAPHGEFALRVAERYITEVEG